MTEKQTFDDLEQKSLLDLTDAEFEERGRRMRARDRQWRKERGLTYVPEINSSPPPGAFTKQFKRAVLAIGDVFVELWTGKPASEFHARRAEKKDGPSPS